MKEVKKNIKLRDANNTVKTLKNKKVIKYDKTDEKKLFKVYEAWNDLSTKLEKLKRRRTNIPEGISEIAICIVKKFYVINQKSISGFKLSFDCFNAKSGDRIQVKAASTDNELTSFGHNSVFDQLFFLDFYYQGIYDGRFKLYEIPVKLISNVKVNSSQTIASQSTQKRRPRTKMRELIKLNNISYDEYQITSKGIIKI
jgi:Bsp6I restriction endonuclease